MRAPWALWWGWSAGLTAGLLLAGRTAGTAGTTRPATSTPDPAPAWPCTDCVLGATFGTTPEAGPDAEADAWSSGAASGAPCAALLDPARLSEVGGMLRGCAESLAALGGYLVDCGEPERRYAPVFGAAAAAFDAEAEFVS